MGCYMTIYQESYRHLCHMWKPRCPCLWILTGLSLISSLKTFEKENNEFKTPDETVSSPTPLWLKPWRWARRCSVPPVVTDCDCGHPAEHPHSPVTTGPALTSTDLSWPIWGNQSVLSPHCATTLNTLASDTTVSPVTMTYAASAWRRRRQMKKSWSSPVWWGRSWWQPSRWYQLHSQLCSTNRRLMEVRVGTWN